MTRDTETRPPAKPEGALATDDGGRPLVDDGGRPVEAASTRKGRKGRKGGAK